MDGLTVGLSAADAAFSAAVDAAVLYKEQAFKTSININVIREPNDGYWSNVSMNKPCGACYKNSTSYALRAVPRRTMTSGGAIHYEIQKIVNNVGSVLCPMFANYVFALSDKDGHNAIAGNWDMDGNKFMER